MKAKALELRDRATFIPLLCVEMLPIECENVAAYEAQLYLLRRVGYACTYGEANILLCRLDASGMVSNDPYFWDDRTFATAHQWIIDHWNTLRDGDVVDVEFILGETTEPKKSERTST